MTSGRCAAPSSVVTAETQGMVADILRGMPLRLASPCILGSVDGRHQDDRSANARSTAREAASRRPRPFGRPV